MFCKSHNHSRTPTKGIVMSFLGSPGKTVSHHTTEGNVIIGWNLDKAKQISAQSCNSAATVVPGEGIPHKENEPLFENLNQES